ncbi:hypothetical protein, partial [Azospirillum sp. TSO22-1]|uniref:hypothetical protein n=1 Tax=Azospirillum sp. TSO22-1 TaxID=716789 RepID=UPI000D610879
VLQFLATSGLLDGGLKIRPMVLPDRFLPQDSPVKQYEEAGLNARSIVATALAALGIMTDAVHPHLLAQVRSGTETGAA